MSVFLQLLVMPAAIAAFAVSSFAQSPNFFPQQMPPQPPPVFLPGGPAQFNRGPIFSQPPAGYQQLGQRCVTNIGICVLNGAGPLGYGCTCFFPVGSAPGQIIP